MALSSSLDDEEVVHQAKKYLWRRARYHRDQPWCLTVSLTHPHDPYAAKQEFWDMYEGVEIPLPEITIPQEEQDPHSKRLLQVMDLWGREMTDEQIKRARRGYAANITYVDSKIGELVELLKQADLLEDTIIVFSGDHGDMVGERGLWYKMNYFEDSARVPMVFHYPKKWAPRRVKESVSTIDLFPTFVEMVGGTSSLEADAGIYLEGRSLCKHLSGDGGHDEVIGEYFGEGTISPLFMIRRGPWKVSVALAGRQSS
jgi:choline-sulfatase